MSILSICQAIQDTSFFTAIRESGFPYPVIMSTHLASIAIFGGMIAMTDLRILGLALKSMTITDVVKQTRPFKYFGFILMISMGIMLGGAKLARYEPNPYFRLKMFLLLLVGVHALIFRKRVYRNTEALDRVPQLPAIAKVAAISSLCIWVGILSCGRWIAYWESPAQKAGLEAVLEDPDHQPARERELAPQEIPGRTDQASEGARTLTLASVPASGTAVAERPAETRGVPQFK